MGEAGETGVQLKHRSQAFQLRLEEAKPEKLGTRPVQLREASEVAIHLMPLLLSCSSLNVLLRPLVRWMVLECKFDQRIDTGRLSRSRLTSSTISLFTSFGVSFLSVSTRLSRLKGHTRDVVLNQSLIEHTRGYLTCVCSGTVGVHCPQDHHILHAVHRYPTGLSALPAAPNGLSAVCTSNNPSPTINGIIECSLILHKQSIVVQHNVSASFSCFVRWKRVKL